MNVISWGDLTGRKPAIDMPVAVTIGVFDGVHIGHQRLIRAIQGTDVLPLVVTFREPPRRSQEPERFPGLILSWRQRLERFESLGVGAVVAIDFSKELSNLTGKAFIGQLTENLTIQRIVVGHNFRFGKSRASGTDDLREMLSGTASGVQVLEPVLWNGEPVSSSRIRGAVELADFDAASAMLGSDHSIDLRPLTPRGRSPVAVCYGRGDVRQVLPPIGTYGVACVRGGGEGPGRLTVGEHDVTLEAADCGDIVTVRFWHTSERSTTHADHEGS
jgi:riboflavin kinase / FMN adenylyltransferase